MNRESRDRMSRLREEYESTPVPGEARERVLAGIAQAKEEQKRLQAANRPEMRQEEQNISYVPEQPAHAAEMRQEEQNISYVPDRPAHAVGLEQARKAQKRRMIMTAGKRIGATAAAAVLAITILTNVNPSIAYAMGQIPLIGSIARVVTFRTYEDKTNHFEADIQVPQVMPDSENKADVAANKSVEEYAQSLIEMYEQDLKASEGQGNYSLTSTYEVVTDTPQYLSIRINTLLVMASGTEYTKIFTIDKTTGETISLAQFLDNDAQRLEAVSENIKEQMVSQMEADESMIYFYQSDMPEWDFEGLKGDESYYINGDGHLVIAFDEYTVAPGYMGAVEFVIPESAAGKF